MIDSVKIHLTAGRGGDGHVSFNRITGKPYGPPEGGDGGKGGDVYFMTSSDLNTLLPFRFKKDFEAGDGEHGGRNHKKGATGSDLVLKVPVGTIVRSLSGEKLVDLPEEGKKVLVALGGRGGRGNAHIPKSAETREMQGIKSEKNEGRWAYLAEKGSVGEEIDLELELQVLADVGLVGLPNAGKSTLLAAITAAKPKIANYPFTTLEPNLGVLVEGKESLVLADIPGLIEGASEGKGLGDQFLRHVQRTKVLVHVISAESGDLVRDYETIRAELGEYDPELLKKKEIVVLNKIDLFDEDEVEQRLKELAGKKVNAIAISAAAVENLDKLKKQLFQS
jgi:GTP-binding protein